MSHRDECLITTVEEATDWLDRYHHTVGTFDPQVLRVIEVLERRQSEALLDAEREWVHINDQLTNANSNLTEAEEKIEKLEAVQEKLLEAAEEWAGYVTADDAPRTLIEHLNRAL